VSGTGWVRARRGVVFGGRDEPTSRRLRVLLREASYRSSRPELKTIGLELISALDVTECLRLLAAGLGLVRGREVNG
jgi:hypothetical protein